MALRGRKPKPSYLRALDGGASHSRVPNPEEPKPVGDLQAPPHWLTDRQKDVWRYAIENAPPGLLKNLDSSIFTIWVISNDLHRESAEKVNQFGALIKSPTTQTPMQSPYVSIMNKQAMLMMKSAAEMGFTPSSRSRVKVPKAPQAANPFGELKSLTD